MFEEIHVNKLLHILVFGESLLNGMMMSITHVVDVTLAKQLECYCILLTYSVILSQMLLQLCCFWF